MYTYANDTIVLNTNDEHSKEVIDPQNEVKILRYQNRNHVH